MHGCPRNRTYLWCIMCLAYHFDMLSAMTVQPGTGRRPFDLCRDYMSALYILWYHSSLRIQYNNICIQDFITSHYRLWYNISLVDLRLRLMFYVCTLLAILNITVDIGEVVPELVDIIFTDRTICYQLFPRNISSASQERIVDNSRCNEDKYPGAA